VRKEVIVVNNRVEVPIPGVSGAEGKEKDKGVAARWGPEEVQI
jgi:hypothetical protein